VPIDTSREVTMRQDASNGFSVAVLSAPVSGWARVLLSGDVEEASAGALKAVIDDLASTPVRVVYIDVAAVTFADSTLVDFCALLRMTVRARTALVVCRPSPMTRSGTGGPGAGSGPAARSPPCWV
jgi:hypothetical protein